MQVRAQCCVCGPVIAAVCCFRGYCFSCVRILLCFPQVSLGPILDMAPIQTTLGMVDELLGDVFSGWRADMNDLGRLASSFMDPSWESVRDDILQPQHQALAQGLLHSSTFEKAGRAATLLLTWKKFLQQVNNDGHGVVFAPTDMLRWGQTVRSCTDYVDIVSVVTQLLQALPAIRNKGQRMAAAKAFFNQKQKQNVAFGRDLSARMEMLLRGDLPPEPAQDPAGPSSDAKAE